MQPYTRRLLPQELIHLAITLRLLFKLVSALKHPHETLNLNAQRFQSLVYLHNILLLCILVNGNLKV